jgi:hypothetical protein
VSTSAERLESELERRYVIAVERSGVVHVYDTDEAVPGSTILPPRDGWPVFSTHTRDAAEELVAVVARRGTDGDCWVIRWLWYGSLRDLGDLRHRLGLEYCRVLGERGASWD